MSVNIVIGVEGNSSLDVVRLAHTGPDGRREVTLRRGESVALPVGGAVEVVSAQHGPSDMPYVLMQAVEVLRRHPLPKWAGVDEQEPPEATEGAA